MLNIIKRINSTYSLCTCSECGKAYKANHKPSKLNPLSHLCKECNTISGQDVTQALVRKFFNYDPTSGLLTWRLPTRGTSVGDKVGTISNGYVQVNIGNKQYRAHRIIWLYMYGYMPEHIDHINHDGLDNSLTNLRDVPQQENNRNMPKRKDNSSGETGIRFIEATGKYVVRIAQKHIGTFKTLAEAITERDNAYIQLNFNANHGK